MKRRFGTNVGIWPVRHVAVWVAVLGLMAGWGGSARGFIVRITLSSVEARVLRADVVVRGRMAWNVSKAGVWRMEISEVIKGKPVGTIYLDPHLYFSRLGNPKDITGMDCIFCLTERTVAEDGWRRWWPADPFFGPWRLDIDDPLAIGMEGRALTSAELLERVREAAKRPEKVNEERMTFLERSYFPKGSAQTYPLEVPVDERLERIALTWVDHWEGTYRAEGARLLSYFRSPAHLAKLRRLLTDPAFAIQARDDYWEPRRDWRAERHFYVREAAARTLKSWGIEEPAEIYTEQRSYEPLVWQKGLAGLIVVVASAGLFRRRGGWVGGAVRWGLVGLAVGVGVLGWRSRGTCDLANWASGRGGDYELASAGGRISLIRVMDGTASRGLAGKCVAWNDKVTPQPWYAPILSPTAQAKHWGFGSSVGRIAGDGEWYDYWRLEAPHVGVMGLLLVVPVVGWVRAAGRAVRRRARRRGGRCMACGYDLRGGVGGRCTECGGVGVVAVG